MAESPRAAGRPRDTGISERALAAARELLAESGFEATTIQAVAGRSGVHASAIYRRWPSRIELIEEAAFPEVSPLDVQPTGDLRRDLRRFIRGYVAVFSAPAARAAAPGLLAHHQHADPAGAVAGEYLRISARPEFRDILIAAAPGSVDPAVDPDDVFDMLIGAIWTRIAAPAALVRQRPIERIVELIARLLRPVNEVE
ncbi:TetR/AcrR family transcriptional regulator [Nocardia sp. 348MFTsu5.1]|uniref:TetR/AcrR family transcriptional regulator n=1 Tax=Nocardia sp. 348MFTsu5.1 TaxID=1172185 RepID=UPI000379E681|nr:TetR/AcrR family transcriptional regulator [Nocardia sp. 348MFTsu5.1]